jgi:hypothetical protein
VDEMYQLKAKESLIVSVALIIISILAFVPLVLVFTIRSIFALCTEYKGKAQADESVYIPTELEEVYE